MAGAVAEGSLASVSHKLLRTSFDIESKEAGVILHRRITTLKAKSSWLPVSIYIINGVRIRMLLSTHNHRAKASGLSENRNAP